MPFEELYQLGEETSHEFEYEPSPSTFYALGTSLATLSISVTSVQWLLSEVCLGVRGRE